MTIGPENIVTICETIVAEVDKIVERRGALNKFFIALMTGDSILLTYLPEDSGKRL